MIRVLITIRHTGHSDTMLTEHAEHTHMCLQGKNNVSYGLIKQIQHVVVVIVAVFGNGDGNVEVCVVVLIIGGVFAVSVGLVSTRSKYVGDFIIIDGACDNIGLAMAIGMSGCSCFPTAQSQ